MTLAYPLCDPRAARPASAMTGAFKRHGVRMTYDRNEEIFSQDDMFELLYRVERGVHPSTYATLADLNEAELIVAGAYGHSRLREWAFGGVTDNFLPRPGRFVLLSH